MLPVISTSNDRLKPRTKEFRTVFKFMLTAAGYEEAGSGRGSAVFL